MLDKLYTRPEFQYIDGAFKHASGWSIKGIGPSTLLRPIHQKLKPSNALASGTAIHKQIELGVADDPCAKAFLEYMGDAYDATCKEALLYGQLWGIDIVAWADCVAYGKDGKPCIIDYKTSRLPADLYYQRINKWRAQVTMEAMLLEQMGLGLVPEVHVLIANPDLANPEVQRLIVTKAEYWDALQYAEQQVRANGHLSASWPSR